MSPECGPAANGLWGEMSVLTGMAAQQADSLYTPHSRRHLLCSAATDGSIAFWDITGPIMDAVDALHQAEGEMQTLGECCCPAALLLPLTKVSIALLTACCLSPGRPTGHHRGPQLRCEQPSHPRDT